MEAKRKAKRERARKLSSQLLSYSKSHAGHVISPENLFNAKWVLEMHDQRHTSIATTQSVAASQRTVSDDFPLEWHQKEAFEEAMTKVCHTPKPVLPPWLPTVVFGNQPGMWHDITCPIYLLDADSKWVTAPASTNEAMFLHKAIDLALSLLKSQRAKEVLLELLEDMVRQWDDGGESHAFTYGDPGNRPWRKGDEVVTHFLEILQRSPPATKLLQGSDNTDGIPCFPKIIPHFRLDPVPLEDLNPREEVTIVVRDQVCSPHTSPSSMNLESWLILILLDDRRDSGHRHVHGPTGYAPSRPARAPRELGIPPLRFRVGYCGLFRLCL